MSIKHLYLLFYTLLLSSTLSSQSFAHALSERVSNYDIQLRLDEDSKQIHAEQVLVFNNPSADTIWTMQFHMYYNAWKNNRTNFMTGSSRAPRDKASEEIERCEWSWIEVTEAKDTLGNALEMHYIQPDDDNTNDQTVLEIRLKTPVLPFQSYRLDMKWQSQIPNLMVRTGYNKDYFFMAQWYPKLGVYESAGQRFATKGQWNCHQYHAATEYFGEFGVYKVSMTVPSDHIVGASGFLLNKEQQGDMTTHTYLAEDVIDFTWVSHPGFMEVEDNWGGVDIRLLIRPEHACTTDRFMKAAKSSLRFFKDYLGGDPYPYPTLTIVSPPYYGLNSGAMEYPTLMTVPTMCDFPKGIKTTETLTIHELTHQFFMQILATNEQEEPWLDEGFTSYFEAKILDKYFDGGIISWPYMRMNISAEEYRRARFFNADNIKVNPLSDFGWHFKHGSYAQIVYGKTAVALSTLEGLIGEELMQEVMQTYFQRWKFKHPGRADFLAVMKEVLEAKLAAKQAKNILSFFDQVVFGTEECDYSVYSIDNKAYTAPLGRFENEEACLNDLNNKKEGYEAKAIIFRLGEMILPQEILVTFDNGEQVLEKWDGQARSHELRYLGSRKIVSVHIDPDNKRPIDRNLINNSMTVEQESLGLMAYLTAFMTWMQALMLSLTALV